MANDIPSLAPLSGSGAAVGSDGRVVGNSILMPAADPLKPASGGYMQPKPQDPLRLAPLSGSGAAIGGDGRVVGNSVLMPAKDPIKPLNAPAKAIPPASIQSLTGSNRVLGNQEAKMMSQFAVPGAGFGKPPKPDSVTPATGYIGASSGAYNHKAYASPKKTGDKPTRARSEYEPPSLTKQERNRLVGEKESILRQYCDSGGSEKYNPDAHKTMGQVTDINRKLGLPPGDTGSWFVKMY